MENDPLLTPPKIWNFLYVSSFLDAIASQEMVLLETWWGWTFWKDFLLLESTPHPEFNKVLLTKQPHLTNFTCLSHLFILLTLPKDCSSNSQSHLKVSWACWPRLQLGSLVYGGTWRFFLSLFTTCSSQLLLCSYIWILHTSKRRQKILLQMQ